MTTRSLIKWLKHETSAEVVSHASGWYAPTRVMTYFDVLEKVAPKRRLRPIDQKLRLNALRYSISAAVLQAKKQAQEE